MNISFENFYQFHQWLDSLRAGLSCWDTLIVRLDVSASNAHKQIFKVTKETDYDRAGVTTSRVATVCVSTCP